jgi:hypothetical protein
MTFMSSFRLYHRIEVTLTMRLMGHEAKSIKPLTEAQAVAAGADVCHPSFT